MNWVGGRLSIRRSAATTPSGQGKHVDMMEKKAEDVALETLGSVTTLVVGITCSCKRLVRMGAMRSDPNQRIVHVLPNTSPAKSKGKILVLLPSFIVTCTPSVMMARMKRTANMSTR